MRQMRQLALVSALLVTAARAEAQAPTTPDLPAVGYGGALANPRYYQFGGCVQGPVAYTAGGAPTIADAFCVRGLLTLGLATFFPNELALQAALSMAYSRDPRIAGPYGELWDSQWASGTLTNAACPTGCPGGVSFSTPYVGMAGQQWYAPQVVSMDPATIFDPQVMRTNLGYTVRDAGAWGTFSSWPASFTLTAVPEPSTYALFATGLLGLAGVARRKRKA